MGKIIFQWKKNQVIAGGEFVNHFLMLQQYVFCITIFLTPHTDRNCWYRFTRWHPQL